VPTQGAIANVTGEPANAAKPARYTPQLIALLVVVALFAAGYWLIARQPQVARASLPTLVVLPLQPVGATADEKILAEGLSEELITRLARTDGLRVISSTSGARAQAENLDLEKLGERLHVTHALEGRLRQAGQQLRIDLRLLEVPGGRMLWAQTFDRNIADVFALEREIAQSVAGALALRLGVGNSDGTEVDPQLFRDYLQARRLATSADRAHGAEMLRAIVAKAPNYARAHASLARILATNLHPGPIAAGEIDEAASEAARALELDANLAETQTALAILACRSAEWARCMEFFRHALALDPADSDTRTSYAYWLGGLGFVDDALREVEIGWTSDPLNYNANFVRARVLDTLGRHEEAQNYLESATPESGGLVYARWHNAIWRHDLAAARKYAAAMPQSDGFRESYAGITEAQADPARWTQVQPMIGTSERATGRVNTLRIMMPNPDYPVEIQGLETMLRNGWPSYYLLLWMPEYSAMRRDPAFQDFLKRTHLIEFWRSSRWPPQCRAQGDGASCD
jgi:TolB-like protein